MSLVLGQSYPMSHMRVYVYTLLYLFFLSVVDMDPDLRRVFILVLLTPLLALVSSDLRGFIFEEDSRTWSEANKYCSNNHNGLLTIRDAAHEATLGDGDGWVGLKRANGVWTWAGGEPLGDLRWVAGEQNTQGNLLPGVLPQRVDSGRWAMCEFWRMTPDSCSRKELFEQN